MDENAKANFEHMKNVYSSQGKRCLLLARKVLPSKLIDDLISSGNDAELDKLAKSDLVLVGLVAIVDPLRPEIPDVVSTLRGAGIRLAMVSVGCNPHKYLTLLTFTVCRLRVILRSLHWL